MASVNYNERDILLSGRFKKRARTSVMFNKPWVDRDVYLVKNKTVMYFDGPKKRGEISLAGDARCCEVPADHANGMDFAFEVSNSYQNPLLLSAGSEKVRNEWVANINRVIDGTWDEYIANLRIVDQVEDLPFRPRGAHDIEAMAVVEGTCREHAMTLDTATREIMVFVQLACHNKSMKAADEREKSLSSKSDHEGDIMRSKRTNSDMVVPGRHLALLQTLYESRAQLRSHTGAEAVAKATDKPSSGGRNNSGSVLTTTLDEREGEEEDGAYARGRNSMDEESVLFIRQCCETHTAAQSESTQLREFCHKQSAEVINYKDSFGVSAVHVVVKTGDVALLQVLIDTGADVRQQDHLGLNTPLHLACIWGHLELVRLLIEHGAGEDVNTLNEGGMTPWHVAAANGRHECLHLLYELSCHKKGSAPSILSARDGRCFTPLHLAVQTGSLETVQTLLSLGAEPESQLFLCCVAGGDVRVSTLHLAAEYGHADILELLFKKTSKKFHLQVRPDIAWTVAHYSVYGGSVECLEICRKYGIPLETGVVFDRGVEEREDRRVGSIGEGELSFPLHKQQAETMEEERRANLRISRRESVRMKSGPVASVRISEAPWASNVPSRANIPENPLCARASPFHIACYYGRTTAAQYLLDVADSMKHDGIKVEVSEERDSEGRSALHYCAMGDQVNLMEMLLQRRVETVEGKGFQDESKSAAEVVNEALNAEDHNGFTPFLLATKYCRLNVVVFLVEKYGVRLDQPTVKLGATPMELAQRYQAEEVIEYLSNQYLGEDEDPLNVTVDSESLVFTESGSRAESHGNSSRSFSFQSAKSH